MVPAGDATRPLLVLVHSWNPREMGNATAAVSDQHGIVRVHVIFVAYHPDLFKPQHALTWELDRMVRFLLPQNKVVHPYRILTKADIEDKPE